MKVKRNISKLTQLLNNQKDIKSYSPYIEGKVLAYSKGITQVVNLKGIDERSADNVYLLNEEFSRW